MDIVRKRHGRKAVSPFPPPPLTKKTNRIPLLCIWCLTITGNGRNGEGEGVLIRKLTKIT